MKKNLTSVLTLLCALLALAAALLNIISLKKTQAELESQLAGLQFQVEQLRLELESEAAISDEAPDISEAANEAFCTLAIDGWSLEDDTLTLDLFAQAVLPEGTAVSDAQLLLTCGDTCHQTEISLSAGEAEGCFEAELSGITFSLSGTAPDQELELVLMVTFTGGNVIQAYGGSWYQEDGQLYLIAG